MAKSSLRRALLGRLGYVLRSWAELLLREAEQGASPVNRKPLESGRLRIESQPPTAAGQGLPPVPAAGVADSEALDPQPQPGSPPAHWLELVRSGEPPAHWLELVEGSETVSLTPTADNQPSVGG